MGNNNQIPISQVADIVLGGTPKRSEESYWAGDIKWASAKDITSVKTRYIYNTEETITALGLEESNTKLLPKDTIVITARGTVGAMAMLSEPMAFNQTCYGLLAKEGVDSTYLFYALKAGLSKIKSVSYGTVFDTITMKSFDAIPIPLPPLEEQKRIAHTLGTLDDKIELNQRMNETLEEIARAVFTSWFVDFDPVRAKMAGEPYPLPDEVMALFPDELVDSELGMIPKGWEITNLGKLCHKPQYGYTESATDVDTGVKFLRITDINKTPWIDWSSVPYCTIEEKDHKKYKLNEGDLLVARIADPGHSTFIDTKTDAVFASYLIRFTPKDKIHSRYLQYWMGSTYFWNLVHSRMTGSTRSNLNATVLKGFPLLKPSYDLCKHFGLVCSVNRDYISKNVFENSILEQTRNTLVDQLI